MANWRDAAELYRQAQVIVEKEKRDGKFAHVARQLQEFLDSPLGTEALGLLRASGKGIRLAGSQDDMGGIIYTLSSDGLLRCISERSCWCRSDEDDDPEERRQTVSKATALEVVQAVAGYRERDPETLLRWVYEELDKIAAAAPRPAK